MDCYPLWALPIALAAEFFGIYLAVFTADTLRRNLADLLNRRLHRRRPFHRPLVGDTQSTVSAHHRRHVRLVAAIDDHALHLAHHRSTLSRVRAGNAIVLWLAASGTD
jgi:hypothetical protein